MSEQEYFEIYDLEKYELQPYDVMEWRAFNYKPLFFNTPMYEKVKNSILTEGTTTLIIGNPLAGKTRIVYDTLSKIEKGKLLIPKKNKEIKEYRLPSSIDNLIVLLDDVDDYCWNNNYALNKLLKFVLFKKIKCVITCRTGPEFSKFKNYLVKHSYHIISVNKYHLPRIDKNSEEFIEFYNKNKDEFKSDLKSFDGNMGSIILPLEDMRKRFNSLIENKKDRALSILLGLKLHYHFLNYESTKSTFDNDKIKFFCNKFLRFYCECCG